MDLAPGAERATIAKGELLCSRLYRLPYKRGYHVRERAAKKHYTLKNVETVAAGKDVQARLFTLAPGEVIPWHSHSEIADHFFVLSAKMS